LLYNIRSVVFKPEGVEEREANGRVAGGPLDIAVDKDSACLEWVSRSQHPRQKYQLIRAWILPIS